MADFRHHLGAFHELDARIVALSSDSIDHARETADKLGPDITVAYELDAAATSRLLGCYAGTHAGRPHVQPTAFVLDADGVIAHAVYSSGKVGRLTAEDALVVAKDLAKKRAAGSAGAKA